MRNLAIRYAWSTIINNSTERMIEDLCKNYTPKNFSYLFTRDLVRDFCEYTKVGYNCINTPSEGIAYSVKSVLNCLGIETEVEKILIEIPESTILTLSEKQRRISLESDVQYIVKLLQ